FSLPASGVLAADTVTARGSTSRRAARAGANVRPTNPATRRAPHNTVAPPYALITARDTAAVARPRQHIGRTSLLGPLAQRLTIRMFCKTIYSPHSGHSNYTVRLSDAMNLTPAARATWTHSHRGALCSNGRWGGSLRIHA